MKQIKPISDKRKGQLKEYYALVARLRTLCGCRSELSGKSCGSYFIEPHHIMGRRGKLLLDPFNIILVTDEEHLGDDGIQKHNTWEMKQKLLAIVKPIRERQGFVEQNKGGIE